VLYDRLGSLEYSDAGLKRLKAGGATVGTDRLSIQLANYRDHRKISVVDGEIGHSGGFNIGQEYIDGGTKYPAWRDTGIRLTGPAVADLEKLFHMRWFDLYGEDFFDVRYFPDTELPHGHILVQTVHQGYDERWNSATRAHQVAMSAASERIQLQSPYFVPDKATFEVLLNAAASGVQVDLLTTGWPDKDFPWWAAESYFEPLLTAGGRVWLWEPGFMHAKSLTVDGQFCSVGSLNMDMRSLAINKENMVWIYDHEIAAKHEAIFRADLQECRALTLEEVRAWPARRRLRNSFARLASNLL
jgi:cardiolipin synthase